MNLKNSIPKNSINDILNELASQQRLGETSLIIRIKPGLIQDAMTILGYRTLFAPVIPGLTATAPIYTEPYRKHRRPIVTSYATMAGRSSEA